MFDTEWQTSAVEATLPTARPVIRGTRVAVDFVEELMADGWTAREIARHFENLTSDGMTAEGIETDDQTGADEGTIFPREFYVGGN